MTASDSSDGESGARARRSRRQGRSGAVRDGTSGDFLGLLRKILEEFEGELTRSVAGVRQLHQKMPKVAETLLIERVKEGTRDLFGKVSEEYKKRGGIGSGAEVLGAVRDVKEQVARLSKEVASLKQAKGREIGAENRSLTYAERLKSVPQAVRAAKTVVVKATDADTTTERVKEWVRDAVKPGAEGIKVSGIRSGRTGVVMTLADEASWQKVVNHKALKAKGLRVEVPEKRMPRVAIYGMERELDQEGLTKGVLAQNFKGLKDVKGDEFVPMYRIGKREHARGAWVVRCSARLRQEMMETGRVYVGWDACRVADEPGLTRCFRCQAYGHLAGRCTGKPICGHCGCEGHERRDCRKEGPAVCGNCRRFGRSSDHEVTSKDCPYYIRQLTLQALRTDYGC